MLYASIAALDNQRLSGLLGEGKGGNSAEQN
jgi:hypothetical protein